MSVAFGSEAVKLARHRGESSPRAAAVREGPKIATTISSFLALRSDPDVGEGRPAVKIGIIYASWFGNGKMLVEKLAEILRKKHHEVTLYSLMEESAGAVPDAELYIFSSPTRKFSLPKNVRDYLGAFVPPRSGTRYALMTTYMDPRTIGLKKMQALLDSKGMLKAAEDCRIKALGLKGPLENGHDEMLLAFADRLPKQ